MSIRAARTRTNLCRVCFSIVILASLACAAVPTVSAQQKLNKRYPTGKNVRIQLKNISGTIIVESWNREEIKLHAVLESPAANLYPRATANGLIIDVMSDNRGRGEIGDITFRLQVPVNATVDLETRQGDISVTNIHGNLVRAHVSSEGDITLTGITAEKVIARNTMGNIFFDGEFSRNGEYQFASGRGDITLRIPADSAFKVVASSQAKRIAMGQFWNDQFRNMGDGRKYEGYVRNGHALVTVTNFQGSITFMRR